MKAQVSKISTELPKDLPSFIWHYLKNEKRYLLGFFFIGLIIAAEISVSPYLLKIMIDNVVEYENAAILLQAILTPAILYVLMNLILNLSFWFLYYLSLRLYPELKASIIKDVLSYLMHHSHAFFQNTFSGSLTKKITDLAVNIEGLIIITNEWFYARVLAIITAAVTLFIVIKPIFGIIIISWAILFIYLAYRAAKGSEKNAKVLSEASSVLDGIISDSISNIASIKLFANIPHEIAYASKQMKILIDSDRKLQFKNSKAQLFQDCSVTILVASLLIALIYGRIQGWVSPGDFGLALMLSVSFIRIVWNIGPQMLKFSKIVGACNQALNLIRIPHEIKDMPNAFPIVVNKGEIRFEDVVFQYEENKPLFNNLSISIKPGEKVGLVGYSGGGKSTFIKLILRLMDPQQGHILIDGQDIKKVTKVSLRKQLGTIPQDPELFHRTIMENIRFAKIEASDEEVIEASKKAKCHEFITELADQYQSVVGERGVKLSGGQKQRIAIARAFLKNAPILLLDEATSSLDSITERDIQESLHEIMKNKTTIVIAHRLSTLKGMDRILVFVNGNIVEDGSSDVLLKNSSGHFHKLWNMQADGFIKSSLDIKDVS